MNAMLKLLAVVLLVGCCLVASTSASSQLQKSNDGQFCDICTFVVQEAEHYANQSVPQIEKALLGACSHLPGSLSNICNTVVLVYGHQIIDYILKEESPQRVCCQLHLCTSNCTETTTAKSSAASAVNQINIVETIAPAKKNDGQCDLCKFGVGQIEAWIASNQTETMIQKRLSMICSLLPAFKDQCNNLVAEVPQIISYLQQQYTPETICSMIGLCPKKVATVAKKNDGQCDLCKFGVGQIEAWVASNATQQLIQKKLSIICNMLPGTFKDQCNQLVTQVPTVIAFLEQAYTPEVICQMVGVCPSRAVNNINDGKCDLCKFGVAQIEAWVASNATVSMIQAKLSNVCVMLPAFQDQCKQLVTQVPQIIMYLEQTYTPEVICQMVGICTSKVATVAESNDGNCYMCKFGVGQIEAWLASNETVTKIQGKLSNICSMLPAFQDQCRQLVTQVPQVITYLEQKYTPEVICQMLGVCTSKVPTLQMTTTFEKSSNSANCDLCKFAVGQIEAWVASNTTQQMIQKKLGIVCNMLPGTFQDQCNQLVAQVPQVIAFLEQAYTPEVICQIIGVCPSRVPVDNKFRDGKCDLCKFGVAQIEAWVASNATVTKIQGKLTKICSMLPAFQSACKQLVTKVPQVINHLEQIYTPEVICQMVGICTTKVPTVESVVVTKKNDGQCDLCKFAVGQIEAWLASNQTITLIEKRLGMVCSLLPGAFKDQCNQIVTQVPTVIAFLEQAYTPEVICQMIGVCPSRAPVARNSNDGQCDLCKFGVGQIEAWLASNQTEQMIQKRLSMVCSLLPAFQAECNQLVTQVPQVITYLEQIYTPEVICQMVGICSSKMAVVKKSNDANCDLCKFGVGQVEAWLASNQTETMIQKRLSLVCNLLPTQFQEQCNQLVTQVPAIIAYLEQAYTPEVICQMVGVCPSKGFGAKKSNDGKCDLCKFGVAQIEAWVASNATVTMIQKRLSNVCSMLPAFQGACNQLVAQVPQVIIYLEQTYTPEVICQMVGICGNKKVSIAESNDGQCDLCKFGVGQIEAWLASNATETMIQAKLSNLCAKLPAFQDQCRQLVTQVPQIIMYLEQTYTPEVICQMVGICTSKVATVAESNDGNCYMCKFGVGQIEAWLASNATVSMIQTKLSNVCAMLPAFQDQCRQLVTQVPQVIQYLEQKYTPDVICTKLGICTSKVPTLQMTTTFEEKNSDILCPACLFVVGLVEQQVNTNHTAAEIEKALDKVCSRLPHPFGDACQSIVKEYTPEIIALITKKLNPSEVCQAIKLCKKKSIVELNEKLVQLLKQKDSSYCPLCLQITTYLENQISSESTMEAVITALKNVCDNVPEGVRGLCKQVVPAAYQELIKFILAKEPPKTICSQLRMCDAMEIAAREQNGALFCDGCKQLVAIADQFLTSESTEAEITRVVQNACNFIPDSYQSMCKAIVQQYGPGLIEQLVSKVLDPTTVCSAVRACPASRQVVAMQVIRQ